MDSISRASCELHPESPQARCRLVAHICLLLANVGQCKNTLRMMESNRPSGHGNSLVLDSPQLPDEGNCGPLPRRLDRKSPALPSVEQGTQDGLGGGTLTSSNQNASACYGTSISSILPSLRRCRTLTRPLPSRKTNTSRSRNSHSFTASSMVMGRMAIESVDFTRWASVVRAIEGNLCTTTGTAVDALAPTAIWISASASTGEAQLLSLGLRCVARRRPLLLSAWVSMCSSAWFTAATMSGASASPTI